MSPDRETHFRELLAYAEQSDAVLGLFLFGSRSREGFADESSDYDVGIVVRDDALEAFRGRWPYQHGAVVEIVSWTLDELRRHARFGTSSEWARYQYVHAPVLIDKTGELSTVLGQKARLDEDEAHDLAAEGIDAFTNSTHRSLRNRALGLERAARLDAVESVTFLLTAVFALERRVRPYNKYLEWELTEHPLDDQRWAAEVLLPRLDRLLRGAKEEQHAAFRDVERVARDRGFGDVIDGWQPDVEWLRGEGAYRG